VALKDALVRKSDLILGLALCVLVLLTWLPRLTGPIDLRWDGGVYYVLGTALAEGRGYRLLNEPGDIEANQYPPLFPAVIAVHQWMAGTSDPTLVGQRLRLTFLLLSIALGLASYALFRRRFAPGLALVAAAVCLLHTSAIFVSDIAFAELPFTVLTVLFFVVARNDEASWSREASAGLLAVAAFLLRTTGIALLAAWVAGALLRRRPRVAAVRFALVFPFVLGWQIHIATVEGGSSYSAPSYTYQRADYLFYNVSYARNVMLRDPNRPEAGRLSLPALAGRVATNLAALPRRCGETITTVREYWRKQIARSSRLPVVGRLFRPRLTEVGLVLLGSLVLAGLARQFLGGDHVMPLYVVLYALAVSTTPWAYSDRYWSPLAPMMIVGLSHLLMRIEEALEARGWHGTRRWGHRLVLAGIALVLVVQVVSLFDFFRERHEPVVYRDRRGEMVSYRLFYYRDTYRALDAGLDVLHEAAEPGAIVSASMPHWVYLRTGLKAVKPPFERDPERALDLLGAVPVAYLIVDGRSNSFTREFGLPAVRQAPDRWESVFADLEGEVEIFRRVAP
jgi:hypothetical protein